MNRRSNDDPVQEEDVRQASSSRRAWLRSALAASLAAGWTNAPGLRRVLADDDATRLIVRSRRPLDLETPVAAFSEWRTPNDVFFVRSHFGEPVTDAATWELEIGGLLERPVRLRLEDLKREHQVTVPAVLQCSGNGRAFYEPRVPGVGWERGAVGNAEWTGLRLGDLLQRAGISPEARHIHLLGADAPPSPKTPTYLRSIPREKALDPSTLVAIAMNSAPLPHLHGGPMRLAVPGWSGNHWIKWLRRIEARRDEAPGFYQQTGYRLPRSPQPPGADIKPSELVPVTSLNVKSLIASPASGSRLKPGRHEVRGVAWTGGNAHVTRVEVAIGPKGRWQAAELLDKGLPYTWRRWRFTWPAEPGRHQLRVRATDSLNQAQPDRTPWNRSGYLWNGVDEVWCEIL